MENVENKVQENEKKTQINKEIKKKQVKNNEEFSDFKRSNLNENRIKIFFLNYNFVCNWNFFYNETHGIKWKTKR